MSLLVMNDLAVLGGLVSAILGVFAFLHVTRRRPAQQPARHTGEDPESAAG